MQSAQEDTATSFQKTTDRNRFERHHFPKLYVKLVTVLWDWKRKDQKSFKYTNPCGGRRVTFPRACFWVSRKETSCPTRTLKKSLWKVKTSWAKWCINTSYIRYLTTPVALDFHFSSLYVEGSYLRCWCLYRLVWVSLIFGGCFFKIRFLKNTFSS